MRRVVEFRAYNLKPGVRAAFHRLVIDVSIPMLQRWRVDVVRFGPSIHDENSYYLIRAYDSLSDRQSSQDAFYAGPEWREGPKDAILPLIESYTTVLIEIDGAVIDSLRSVPS
jgi:hypothetical protein